MTLNYLLDTCVISEFVKPKPEKRVLDWLNETDTERVYLSAVTLGEIQRGISEKPASNRRAELEEWFNSMLMAQFSGRILPLNEEVFIAWGHMTALLKARGKPMSVMDSLIAAMAMHHKMVLVTRNAADFSVVDLTFQPLGVMRRSVVQLEGDLAQTSPQSTPG